MRVNACCVTMVVVSTLLVSGTIARAQSAVPCVLGVMSYAGLGQQNITGAPYSAALRTSFEQKLPDGNAIRSSQIVHQARDSKGRTLNEAPIGCTHAEDGRLKAVVAVTVFDPTTKTIMNWQVDDTVSKVVHVYVMHEPNRKLPTAEEAAEQMNRSQMAARTQKNNEVRIENLGSKTVAGVQVEGVRRVRTIPAGEEGNDLPMEVIDEQWSSKALSLILRRIDDDPRRGRTTVEFEDLSLSEPDPAVFAAPAGYKIVEQHQVETTVAP